MLSLHRSAVPSRFLPVPIFFPTNLQYRNQLQDPTHVTANEDLTEGRSACRARVMTTVRHFHDDKAPDGQLKHIALDYYIFYIVTRVITI